MKILWLCNVELPLISQHCKRQASVYGGWLDSVSNQLIKDHKLAVLYPASFCEAGSLVNLTFYSFTDSSAERIMEDVVNKWKPDIIHIWGTEFIFSNTFVKILERNNLLPRCVVSIQGLVSILKIHYAEGIPENIYKRYTFRDILKRENIKTAQKQFEYRGQYEIDTIKRVRNFIGRTDWDQACIKRLNRNANYFFCNETLRNEFYSGIWDLSLIRRHSIFISQSSYPIKGFHNVLNALPDILSVYPDTHVYTTGMDLTNLSFVQKMKLGSYQKYIHDLIITNQLEDKVSFLGVLDAQKMKDQYLSANVFVCPSSIENSPNSVGEAMLLGCPVVSSYVGGTMNMLKHGEEGFLYQSTAPYMLAYYVNKIFSDDALALRFSKKGRLHAVSIHNAEQNYSTLMEIYKKISDRTENM